jgi:MOSC domain-containing protein YiiM
MRMKIVSLNVGLPREVTWHGMNVVTGIFKQPVEGRVALRKLNLDGDRQADLTVHGGKDKAVYCYPLSHYDFWKHELPRTGSGAAFLADFARSVDLPMGMFGENFTIDVREGDSESNEDACAPFLPGSGRSGEPVGTPFLAALARTGDLPEDSIHIGDRFSVGSAEVVVTQPRLPCYKLGLKFQMDDMVKRFLASRRTGFYLAVTREGEVGAGDELKPIVRRPQDEETATPISEITRLYISKHYSEADARSIQRALQVASLPENWKEYFRERLEMKKLEV